MIFELIIVILNNDIGSVKILANLEKYFQNMDYNEIIFSLLFAVCFIYLIKNIFIIYCHWYNTTFVNRVDLKINKKLLHLYLNQDYLEFLKQNSAIKFQNIKNEVSIFVKYLYAIMTLTFETTVLIGVLIFFMIIQPFPTLIIGSIMIVKRRT